MLVRKSLPNDGAAGAGVIDRVPAGDGSAGVVAMAAGAISAAFGGTVVAGAASASDIDGA